MPHRLVSTATALLLVLATLFFASIAAGQPPAATAPATKPSTQPAFDPAKLLGRWTTNYKAGDSPRTLTYTFKPDGTFDEYESNWGRNWGKWRLEGDTLHMYWMRRGFSGRMQILTLTDAEWTVRYPAPTTRTYTRPAE